MTVSAAKLQVLALDPVKERLGAKWPRLAELVHKLFEAAIAHAQGPHDSYVRLDELCYGAIFRGLPVEDVQLICQGIAREVCQALFGEDIDEVSIRSVVAQITLTNGFDAANSGATLNQAIERNGEARIVVNKADGSKSKVQTRAIDPSHADAGEAPPPSILRRIIAAHELLAKFGLKMRFLPVWNLRQCNSTTLFLMAMSASLQPEKAIECSERGAARARYAVEVAIAMLDAAAAYAERAAKAQQVCAIGTEVSFDILTSMRTRTAYLAALRHITEGFGAPLVLKIVHIPKGTLPARVGEVAALLNSPNIRVLLEFESVAAIPSFDFRIHAKGMGSPMPQDGNQERVEQAVKQAVGDAALHRLFIFLEELNTEPSLDLARDCGVRFGIGLALSTQSFSGIEPLPQFPLRCRPAA